MAEPNVIDIKSAPEKKARVLRPRFDQIQEHHIVDTWRMAQRALYDENQDYPDITEDNPDVILSELFVYMKKPTFFGLMAKLGKRPIGMVIGETIERKFGRPSKYFFVNTIYIDPKFRKQGVGQALFKELIAEMRKKQIFHWEAAAHAPLVKYLERSEGIPVRTLFHVIGGRF